MEHYSESTREALDRLNLPMDEDVERSRASQEEQPDQDSE